MSAIHHQYHNCIVRSMSCADLQKMHMIRSKSIQNKCTAILEKNKVRCYDHCRHQNYCIYKCISHHSLHNNRKNYLPKLIYDPSDIQNRNQANLIKIVNNTNNEIKKYKLLPQLLPLNIKQKQQTKLKKSQSTFNLHKKPYKNFIITNKLHPNTIKRINQNPLHQKQRYSFINKYHTAPQTSVDKSSQQFKQQQLQHSKSNILFNTISPIQSKYQPLTSIQEISGLSLLDNIQQNKTKAMQINSQGQKICMNKLINKQLQLCEHQPQGKMKKIFNKRLPCDFFLRA